MHIAIVSDTHNQERTVSRVVRELGERNIETVLHCGDIESPSIIPLFSGMNAHFVFGNCDYNQTGLREAMREQGFTCHDLAGVLELEGMQIAFTHSHEAQLMSGLETSDEYDFLFYGHTHVAKEHRTGKTRVINPGALHRASPKSYLILDLETGETESMIVSDVT